MYKRYNSYIFVHRSSLGHRLQNIQVLVGPNHASFPNVCGSFIGPAANGDLVIITCNDLIVGKVIRIVKEGVGVLSMCEVEVFEVVQYSCKFKYNMGGSNGRQGVWNPLENKRCNMFP